MPSLNILVVDDSSTMRTIIRRCLESLKIGQIFEAADGQLALQTFEQIGIDLVISDWNMPNMDGMELLEAIRERNKKIPIIMVTTEAERSQVVKAISGGVSDYLIKPFDGETIRQKMLKWSQRMTELV